MVSRRLGGSAASEEHFAKPRQPTGKAGEAAPMMWMTILLEKDLVEDLAGYGKLRLDINCPDKRAGFSFMLKNMNPRISESGQSRVTEVTTDWATLKNALSDAAGVVFMDPSEEAKAPFLVEGTTHRSMFARGETLHETIERITRN